MKKIFTLLALSAIILNANAQKPGSTDVPVQLQASKVIVVKITSEASGWKAEIIRTDYGAPTLNIKKQQDVILTALTAAGKEIFSVSFDDPRVYYIDDGPGGENGKRTDATGERFIMLPFDAAIAELEIKGVAQEYKNVLQKFPVADQVKNLK